MVWFQSESGGLRTRRADCTVPVNACRFKTQGEPVLSVQVQSQEDKTELKSQFKAVRQEEFPPPQWKGSPCVLFRSSTDWTRPSRIREGHLLFSDFPCDSDGKASAYNAGDPGSIPGSGRSAGEGNGHPLQYSCPPHRRRSLVGYGPWGRQESDTTERLHVHFLLFSACHFGC